MKKWSAIGEAVCVERMREITNSFTTIQQMLHMALTCLYSALTAAPKLLAIADAAGSNCQHMMHDPESRSLN